MSERPRIAPEGTVWICPHCGRTGKDRFRMGDISCSLHAVLCYEEKYYDTELGAWLYQPLSEVTA